MPVTACPVSTSTPSLRSCTRAFSDSDSGIDGSTRGPASTRCTLAVRGSLRRNSRGKVWRAISASVPASSTPVGPPPMTTKFSHSARAAGSLSRSANSNASSMWRRMKKASSSVFSPGACAAQSSCPK